MGTNYYLKEKCCPACNRSDQRHIGKSSAGWCFALRVYPDDEINSLDDWKRLFADPASRIENEYGDIIPPQVMLQSIEGRTWDNPKDSRFFRENDCVAGPNNLARHKVGRHCVGHGEGTWDYMACEFS